MKFRTLIQLGGSVVMRTAWVALAEGVDPDVVRDRALATFAETVRGQTLVELRCASADGEPLVRRLVGVGAIELVTVQIAD